MQEELVSLGSRARLDTPSRGANIERKDATLQQHMLFAREVRRGPDAETSGHGDFAFTFLATQNYPELQK